MPAHGNDGDVRLYFGDQEYFKLLCDMMDLHDLITTAATVERDAGEQEELDAIFVHLGSRIEEDLAAVRPNLDQHFRQLSRSVRWTSTHVDNRDPLERDAEGHAIHDLGLVERSRKAKIKRSPDAQYALRVGYMHGLLYACAPWIAATLVAPYFGVWAFWVKWAIIVLGFVYLLLPKYIDSYPSMDPSKELEMVSRRIKRVGEDNAGKRTH